jgi:hypothetical protein
MGTFSSGGEQRSCWSPSNIVRISTRWSYSWYGAYGNFATRVFEGASPCAPRIIQDIKDEARMLCMAGAKGLSFIWP